MSVDGCQAGPASQCSVPQHQLFYASFSPVASGTRTVPPRRWDRKPSTSYLPRPKARGKLWKRFRTSFNSVRAARHCRRLQGPDGAEDGRSCAEINERRKRAGPDSRGVKRLRLSTLHVVHGGGGAEADDEPEASFLVTKWEAETGRRRKLPFQLAELAEPAEPAESVDSVDSASPASPASPANSEPTTLTANDKDRQSGLSVAEQAAELKSTLDGDDTELLNSFLSKARARRQARHQAKADLGLSDAAEQQQANASDSAHVSSHQQPARVLGQLDSNLASARQPRKDPEDSKLHSRVDSAVGDCAAAAASPVCRRSSRVSRTPRTTISLRRAKGTEFVFLQRTEAQEIALATRRNTKRNKGDAQLPPVVLEGLARQAGRSGSVEPAAKQAEEPCDPRDAPGPKRVRWNELRLVEFEGQERHLAAKRLRRGARDRDNADASLTTDTTHPTPTSHPTHTTHTARASSIPVPAASTPSARRVRRLGPSATATSGASRRRPGRLDFSGMLKSVKSQT